MKFMLTFCIKPETRSRDEALARFKATGGQPPKRRETPWALDLCRFQRRLRPLGKR